MDQMQNELSRAKRGCSIDAPPRVGHVSKNVSDIEHMSGELAEPISHSTIFIPYYTETKDAPINTQFALILAQIGGHGKMKRVKSEKSLKEYLSDKISTFMTNSGLKTGMSEQDGQSNYQSSEATSPMNKFGRMANQHGSLNTSGQLYADKFDQTKYFENGDPQKMKVIVVTIAAC